MRATPIFAFPRGEGFCGKWPAVAGMLAFFGLQGSTAEDLHLRRPGEVQSCVTHARERRITRGNVAPFSTPRRHESIRLRYPAKLASNERKMWPFVLWRAQSRSALWPPGTA